MYFTTVSTILTKDNLLYLLTLFAKIINDIENCLLKITKRLG